MLVFEEKYLQAFPKLKDFSKYKNSNKLEDFLEQTGCFFLTKSVAEELPNFKQIIPYSLLRNGDGYFCYQRSKKGGESRLHNLWSVGIGGHVNLEDEDLYTMDSIQECIEREFLEELNINIVADSECFLIGLLYDDSNDVGRVHFGLVYEVHTAYRLDKIKPSKEIGNGKFLSISAIKEKELETWSRLIVDTLE